MQLYRNQCVSLPQTKLHTLLLQCRGKTLSCLKVTGVSIHETDFKKYERWPQHMVSIKKTLFAIKTMPGETTALVHKTHSHDVSFFFFLITNKKKSDRNKVTGNRGQYSSIGNLWLYIFTSVQQKSHQQSLNSQLDRLDLRFQLRALLYGDRGSDDGTRHSTGTSQRLLGADKHVRHILVLTEERQMEDDLQWFSISCHHNKFGNASVQGFSGWKIRSQ